MNKKLIIIGNTSNAKLACYYFQKDTDFTVVGFSVDKQYIEADEFCELPVFEFEDIENTHPPSEYYLFVAIGYGLMNEVRKEKYEACKSKGYTLPNYLSPRCSFLTGEDIGDNNFILEDNTIQPFVKIGSNNVLWSGNHIGHDVTIGDHNFFTSHVVVSGFTKIKDSCFLGVNCTLRDNISIASKTLIAAGAIIMHDTKEEDVYLPAKSVLYSKKSTQLKIS